MRLRTHAFSIAVLGASLVGCSSAKMAGGKPRIPGDEPEGRQLGVFRTEACTDAKGAPALDPDAKVRIIETRDKKLVLVDTRFGYDTVVSDNGERKGAEWVFDVALKKTGGRPHLRQYRLPATFDGRGRYLLTARFEDREVGDTFHAEVLLPAVECTLAPARL